MSFLIAQATQPDDIRDIITIAPDASILPVILWIVGILFLIGFIVWLVLFLLKRAKRLAYEAAPETIAIKSLQRLQLEMEDMDPNVFGLEVSETLKNYLSAKFNDPIRYETAEEFLSRFANSAIPVTQLPTSVHQHLRTFVSSSEEIKFARTSDAREKMEPLLGLASRIVSLIETVNQSEKQKQDDSFI